MNTKRATCFVVLLGCAASSTVDAPNASPDAAFSLDSSTPDAVLPDALIPMDAGADTGMESCGPHEFFGCSSASGRWVWNGEACERIVECRSLGYATRRACAEAHVQCGAVIPAAPCEEIACPHHCSISCDGEEPSFCDCGDENSFVLIHEERTCADNGEDAWLFTLAPIVETLPTGRHRGMLQDGIVEASETIGIRLFADRDAFHDPQEVLVGDSSLQIWRCHRGETGCEAPSSGVVEIETGGVGELRVDMRFRFGDRDIRVAPEWFSSTDTRDGGC